MTLLPSLAPIAVLREYHASLKSFGFSKERRPVTPKVAGSRRATATPRPNGRHPSRPLHCYSAAIMRLLAFRNQLEQANSALCVKGVSGPRNHHPTVGASRGSSICNHRWPEPEHDLLGATAP
jgi:hypothetical protein